MRRIVDHRHIGCTAVLKKPWQGQGSGTVTGWWSGGLQLLIGGERLDFAFCEIERVSIGGEREAAA